MPYTSEELIEAVKNSDCYSGVLRYLNKSITGISHQHIQRVIKEQNIDIRHFVFQKSRKHNCKKKQWSEILIFDRDLKARQQGNRLTIALIESGRIYQCEGCGISKWKDKKITLEVDHKDGNWRNNSPENLRLVCPNCHSLTPNFYHIKSIQRCECGNTKSYGSKLCRRCSNELKASYNPPVSILKLRKTEWPTKEYLEKLVWEKPSSTIAKQFNVSDTTIKKWCRKYNIQKPPRGYWSKLKTFDT